MLSVEGMDSPTTLIDIEKTIEQLSLAGASLQQSLDESQRRIEQLANPSVQEVSIESGCVDSEVAQDEIAEFKSHDVLLPDYIDQWVRNLSRALGCRVALYIANSRGKVQESKSIGWDSALFRMNKKGVEQVVRSCILQPKILLSANCTAPKPEPRTPESHPDELDSGEAQDALQNSAAELPKGKSNASFCVNLNRLSKVVGCPLMAVAWKLEKSSSYAVLFIDGAHDFSTGTQCLASDAFIPSLPQSKAMAHELDAWFLLRRCNWLIRWMHRGDWLTAHPKYVVIPALLFVLGLACPVPYYPRRECVIEPESKQYVSSPVAGRISKSWVRPGDHVEKNQLLASLDDEDLRRELATAEAELEGAQKKFNSALAQKSSGDRGIAKVEIQKAETKIESLNEQLHRLEVRSTSSGVVVQGDWHKSVGSPVTLGQNLFEIAELDSMTAEIHLTPIDLGYINVGDRVAVRSDASGGHTFQGQIRRIEPRAKIENGEAFFIADVDIRDPDIELRPGMKAHAKVSAGWKTVGWLLFSRPYRWLANQWIW